MFIKKYIYINIIIKKKKDDQKRFKETNKSLVDIYAGIIKNNDDKQEIKLF